jgi:hypothetical protein
MANYFWVGGSGTWDNTNTTNWSASSGGAGGVGPPLSTDTVTFDALSGTGTCTTGTGAVCSTLTFDTSTVTLSLGDNVTCSSTFTLTLGSVDLVSYILSCSAFSSSNSNTRSIAFGTGKIQVTGNAATLVVVTTSTGFTASGSLLVESTYAGSTGTRTFTMGSAASGAVEANALNIAVTGGTDTVALTTNRRLGGFDLTGFSGTVNLNSGIFYGDVIFSSGATIGTIAGVTFSKSSGIQKITTNGKSLDCPVVKNGAGIIQFQDNLTTASTRTFTLTEGTLDLTGNSGNWTLSTGVFASSNSNTRNIAFGTGNITVIGSGTVWNTGTVTNFSYSGTPTVNISNNSATATTVTTGTMSAAQALNFNYTVGTYTLTDTNAVYKNVNFTGFTGTLNNAARTVYGNLTVVAGMTLTAGANATTFAATSGTQQITTNGKTLDFPLTFNGIGGTFAFQDALTQGSTRAFNVINGTVKLKNGVTSTVGSFVTSGVNQKFLESTLAGSQATLSQASGTINASNLTIKDINATGGATWNAFTTSGNVDAGNNTGWDFFTQLGKYIYTRRKNKRILL